MTTVVLRLRTPHGAPVTGAQVTLASNHGAQSVSELPGRPGRYRFTLDEPGGHQLTVKRLADEDGFDHRTLRGSFFYTPAGTGRPVLKLIRGRDRGGSRLQRARWTGRRFRIDAVLDYLWFTPAGTPPTTGNQLDLLIEGEEGWGAIADAIEQAEHTVHLTTWSYQPTLECRRQDPLASRQQREAHTMHELLEAAGARGATVRLLVWDAPVIQQPKEARQAARDRHDNFEVLEQANPTEVPIANEEHMGWFNDLFGGFRIGSYHQKTVIIDDQLGFAGGMNMRENDWDTRKHKLFDPRRARFDRRPSFRKKVKDLLETPDYPPRHDFFTRVRGPAVKHLAENFQDRWNLCIDSGEDHGGRWHATKVDHLPEDLPRPGSTQVQVVRTMPAPFNEKGILDTHLRAIEKARKLIYIDDQYFRSTLVSNAIADAVRRWPELNVVAVTNQNKADSVVGGSWARACFERIQGRKEDFRLYALKCWEVDAKGKGHLVEVDNHSKLLIVDDRFMSIGSCNVNDRGFEYEGELNLAIFDPDLVRRERTRLWRDLLGGSGAISGDIDADSALWSQAADHNARFEETQQGTPMGLVFPFEPQRGEPLVTGRLIF